MSIAIKRRRYAEWAEEEEEDGDRRSGILGIVQRKENFQRHRYRSRQCVAGHIQYCPAAAADTDIGVILYRRQSLIL